MDNVRLGNVMIDCNDEQGLCEFYYKLLGWEKSIMFGRPALRSDNGIVFLFIVMANIARILYVQMVASCSV